MTKYVCQNMYPTQMALAQNLSNSIVQNKRRSKNISNHDCLTYSKLYCRSKNVLNLDQNTALNQVKKGFPIKVMRTHKKINAIKHRRRCQLLVHVSCRYYELRLISMNKDCIPFFQSGKIGCQACECYWKIDI